MNTTSLSFVPLLLVKKEEIVMSFGEEMKVAVLLLFECHQKSCGNVIKNAKEKIKNAAWRGLLGLAHRKYEKLLEKGALGLWHWDGNDIVVDLYSCEWEQRRLARVEGGRRGGMASGHSRTQGTKLPTEEGSMLGSMLGRRLEQYKFKEEKSKRRGEGEDTTVLSNPAVVEAPHTPPLPPPASVADVLQALQYIPGISDRSESELESIATDFYDKYAAQKWCNASGTPLPNWRNDLLIYAASTGKPTP